MSQWGLSLSTLANQAEAFLENVDKRTADSLVDDEDEETEDENEDNIFTTLSSSLVVSQNTAQTTNFEKAYSSPELVGDMPDILSLSSDKSSENERAVGDNEQSERLELENNLIRQEIIQLTEEIGILSNKLKTYQEQCMEHEKSHRLQKEKLVTTERDLARYHREVRGLKDRESDLADSISAKDTQIGVLKVRLAEADAQISSSKAKSKLLEEEVKISSSFFNELNELKIIIQNSDKDVIKYKEEIGRIKHDGCVKENEFKTQIAQKETSLQHSEHLLQTEKKKYSRVVSDLQTSRGELDNVKKELVTYKARATRILQEREEGSDKKNLTFDNETVEILLLEKRNLEGRVESSKLEIEILKDNINNLETLHSEEMQQVLEKCSESESRLRDKDLAITEYENKVSHLKEDVFVTQKSLTTKSYEIQKLKTELQTERETRKNSSVVPSEGELQVKVESLTEVLITKQTEVERLNSERNSLVLKLESLETVLQRVEIKNNQVNIPIEKDSSSLEILSRNKRLKDALNTLDKFSIRLAVFLRRYPAARLMILGYMLLLHTWVMVVLLTYTPEIHDHPLP